MLPAGTNKYIVFKMQIFLNVVRMITVGIKGIILACVIKSCGINAYLELQNG